jgi:fused signal recognition particle receptor
MFRFLKRHKNKAPSEKTADQKNTDLVEDARVDMEMEAFDTPEIVPAEMAKEIIIDVKETNEPLPTKETFFTRLKKSLNRTRQSFTQSIASLILGKKEIDADLLE